MAYPIIILEGPDTCGKTTLANALAKRTNGYVMHQTYRFKNQMVNYHTAVWNMAKKRSQKQVVILDRWWPSEIVYSNVYRSGPAHPTYWRCLDRDAARYGVAYIWCVPRRLELYQSFLRQNYGKQEQMYSMDSMSRVWEHYRDLLYWTLPRSCRDLIFHYDVTTDVYGSDLFAKYVVSRTSDWFKSHPKGLIRAMFAKDKSYSGNLKNPKQVFVIEPVLSDFNHMVGLSHISEKLNLYMDDNDIHENRTAFITPGQHELLEYWKSRRDPPNFMEFS